MKRRTESFFGLHFDFHARETTKNIGKTFKYEWIDELLETVKPDFVQCDTKGHPGITSYPSAYGTSAPEMKIDILKAWRELTKKHDVALYAHYSGVYDEEAAKNHPDWAVVDKNGVVDKDHMSVFGPYVDEKLLPQLKELAGVYELDGAWVDGECWGCRLDFSEHAQKAFEEKYQKKVDYKKDKDTYLEFCRDGYWAYVTHYMAEMKKAYPDFQITSNWAMSSYSPYIYKDYPFTFLSGDLTWIDAIDNGARFETRFISQNGLPWDIMSWSFVHFSEDCTPRMRMYKPAIQIKQEVSHTLAFGGGVQLYFMQSPESGIANRDVLKVSKEVSDFCRKRERFCWRKEIVKEVGILFSSKEYYNEIDEVMFTARKEYMEDFRFVNNALLDNSYSTTFSIVEKNKNLDGYKTVVLTNTDLMYPEEIGRLISYSKNGGNLLVIGERSSRLFAQVLGIKATFRDSGRFIIENGERFIECEKRLCLLDPLAFDRIVKGFYDYEGYYDENADYFAAIAEKKLGSGNITFIPFELGNAYANRKSVVLRDFLKEAVHVSPMAEIRNTHLVDVVITKDEDKKYIHIINNGGRHSSPTPTLFDEIPPLYDLQISIECEQKPQAVLAQPEGVEIPFTYANGKIQLQLKKLEIYTILEIE